MPPIAPLLHSQVAECTTFLIYDQELDATAFVANKTDTAAICQSSCCADVRCVPAAGCWPLTNSLACPQLPVVDIFFKFGRTIPAMILRMFFFFAGVQPKNSI